MYLLADWYADAVEPVTPCRRRTPPAVGCRTQKTEWGERRRSSPRVNKVSGERLRDVKRPACFSVADRRVSKLRPWLRVSRAADMKSQSKRKTHSDQLAEDVAQDALRPQCPAGEAINLSHRTSDQREKRSAPARRTGALRVKDQRQTPTAGLDRGRRTSVNFVDSARAGCEGPTSNSALPAFPRGRL